MKDIQKTIEKKIRRVFGTCIEMMEHIKDKDAWKMTQNYIEKAVIEIAALVQSTLVQQWSSVVPKADGRYWVTYSIQNKPMLGYARILIHINNNRKKTKIIRTEYGEMTLKSFCENHPDARWQPLPEPPLPTKNEKTKGKK